MSYPIPNIYHLRTVASTSAKSCLICFKPSTAVLITPDSKDHFYICKGHLKDKGFASPVEDPEAKRKEALKVETEKIHKEWREKVAAREKREKEKGEGKGKGKGKGKEEGEKDKDKEKGKGKGKDEEDKDKGKEEDEKKEDAEPGSENKDGESPAEDIPRIYNLHRNFYQMRIDRIRKAELAKRNRDRLSNPNTFPTVPSGAPL